MALQYRDLSDKGWLAKIAGIDEAPLFSVPDAQLQKGTVGKSGVDALRDAWMFWKFVNRMSEESGHIIGPESRVLDFGVSWGRILRFFLRDTEARNLSGVDVTEKFLGEAKKSLPSECDLRKSNPAPRLPYDDDSFDVIYAFSVFSHLPESLTNQWVSEFMRILKRGGIACLTTRPRAHFQTDLIKTLSKGEQAFHEKLYDEGKFVFFASDGGSGLNADIYGEALIPSAYAKNNWPLNLVQYAEGYAETYLQPCFVLQKT